MQPQPYPQQPYPGGPVAPQPQPYPQQPYAYPQPQPQPYPQPYPGQFPAGYPAPYPTPPQPPVQPMAQGTLDGYYGQPSTGGGKAWSFHNRPNGTTYLGVVARPITNADVQQQSDMTTGAPRFFKDGSPMFVMIVPVLVPQSPEFPDGVATWWVRGQARDDLVRAMAEAGAPVGPPEAGAVVQVTKVSERAGRPGHNPSYQYRVVYTRPTGEEPAATLARIMAGQPAPQAQQPQQPAMGYAAPGAPTALAPAYAPQQPQPQYAPQPYPQPQPQYAPQPAQMAAPAPQQYAAAPQQPTQPQPVYAPQAQQQQQQQYAPAPMAGVNPLMAPGDPLSALPPESRALMAQLVGQPTA